MKEKAPKNQASWFWKWFLNNQLVTVLIIILLFLINIWMFTKVAYLFTPLQSLSKIVGLPVIGAGILFYLLKPGMQFLQKKGIPKKYAVWIMLIVMVLVIVAMVFSVIPIIQQQIVDFVSQWPYYYEATANQVNTFIKSRAWEEIQAQLTQINLDFVKSFTSKLNGVVNTTFLGLGSVVGAVSEIVIGLITMPIILYYLMVDGEKILPTVAKFFPTKSRKKIIEVFSEMNDQISQYIRGQITVALAVAIMFMIGYAIIGLPYGMTIAILAGMLNIIPYVGSFFGMVPAVIVAFVHSPWMLLQVIIVFSIEQTIEGRILSPLILGNSLKIHPATILFILLTAGRLFGLVGLLLGIPGYAVLKVIVTHLFAWYKEHSGLYPEVIPIVNLPEGEQAELLEKNKK
ncbi:Predicted PurR-regulated permease PerM [Granulicatella balaenopterae]|uniref:Predicted PurR-regulated permease PerM n=1 Tax=Granulicatella balaenopterae TaxID=137733 RepID=A0A1H9H6J8_9LACT|nr:AI-2E family transporter [Granulicatella balaenopterae]SEQ57955.1 Predicted PurR-regulated permease PerM [Granulicatella balaenopterae]